MQAVILAAGLGTRMGELTKDTPKPMLKINNKPILAHQLEALPDEVDEVVLVVGHLDEQIKNYFGEEYLGKKIVYVKQDELKGTGHALSLCKDVLRGRFLVLMGDDLYSKSDLEKMLNYPLAVLAWELKEDDLENDRQAIVRLNERGELSEIVERQPAKKDVLVNTGAYLLDMGYFDHPLIKAGNKTDEYGLPQTFVQMIKSGARFFVVRAGWWHKIVSGEDLVLK